MTATSDDINRVNKTKITTISSFMIDILYSLLIIFKAESWNCLCEKSWNKYLEIDSATIKLEVINIILTIDLSPFFIRVNKLSKPIEAKAEIENWKTINIIDGTLNLLKNGK